MGDSAGGGLSLALCMYLRDEGHKLPAGLVLLSPWVDLTMSCGSWDENAQTDVVPQPKADGECLSDFEYCASGAISPPLMRDKSADMQTTSTPLAVTSGPTGYPNTLPTPTPLPSSATCPVFRLC